MNNSAGYTLCRGCDEPVIGDPLCCYCEENRVEFCMSDVDDLTPDEIDTLGTMAFSENENGERAA